MEVFHHEGPKARRKFNKNGWKEIIRKNTQDAAFKT
jgi:hypothetical protein